MGLWPALLCGVTLFFAGAMRRARVALTACGRGGAVWRVLGAGYRGDVPGGVGAGGRCFWPRGLLELMDRGAAGAAVTSGLC